MKNDVDDLVSIVLPVYNGETYLKISIESCLNQTYKNWELLIIDDGSTDGSAAIAKEYEKRDKRIHYFKNEENLKLPRTLNKGFSLAKGTYLTWTSDDNYYLPRALEEMVKTLKKGTCEFVFASCAVINEQGETLSVIRAPEDYVHAIWDHNFVAACFMYSRNVYETIGEYDPALFLCEDYDYWLRIFAQFPIGCIDELLYAWRKHEKSLSFTHRQEQYRMLENVLLKNFEKKVNAETLDYFYLYRGLNRSRGLRKNIREKYYYLPKLIYYKIWHKIIYPICR